MCNFEIPTLLYFAFIPTLVASLYLAIFVFFSNYKSSVNRNFTYFILLYFFWNLTELGQWKILNVNQNLLFARLSVLFSFGILFFLYFTYAISDSPLSKIKKMLFALPFLPIVTLLFTNLNAYIENSSTCANQQGGIYYYVYFLILVYLAWSLRILIAKIKKSTNIVRIKLKLILIAFGVTIGWFLLFTILYAIILEKNISLANNLSLFAPIGMIFFIGVVSYVIEKYQIFDTKILLTQIAVYTLWILIGSLFFIDPDNTEIVILVVTSALTFVFGIVLIRSVKREVRRREEIQALSTQLAAANKQLKSLDELKTEFLSIATHQLRTPLTGIKGYISMIADGDFGEIKPEQKKILQEVLDNTEKLVHLIADFLDVSRIERGKLEINRKPTNIEKMVEGIVHIFQPNAQEKRVQLVYHGPTESIPEIQMDEDKFRQVILNVVDNAIKYTPTGRIDVYLTKKPDRFLFESRDTGVGMNDADKMRLFQRFSRASDAFKTNATGTGLGMYVAKNVVERHGGRIWAESAGRGKGTSFFVEVPFDQSHIKEPELSPEQKAANEANKQTETLSKRLENIV